VFVCVFVCMYNCICVCVYECICVCVCVGVLKNHTEAYKQQPAKLLSYLPIAHVRDSLIPLKDR